MLTLLAGKVYSQSRECNIEDIGDCDLALQDPTNILPTAKCCNELRQHLDCIWFYKEFFYFNIGKTVRDKCHIDWNGTCEL